MSHHQVRVLWLDGKTTIFEKVVDVNHWDSALVELRWADGRAKIIKNFEAIDISVPLDDEGEPIQMLHEVNNRPDDIRPL